MLKNKLNLAVISSYSPRECGIATFSKDLSLHLKRQFKNINIEIIPINNEGKSYAYQKGIKNFIQEEDIKSYYSVAHYINNSKVNVVNIQHEFGLFGGKSGEYVIELLERINKPIVTTLHTLLLEPSLDQKKIVQKIAQRSAVVVVMAKSAITILKEIYNVPVNKIFFIPHGVRDVAFESQKKQKKLLGLKDNFVVTTFGLIGRDKGLKYAIESIGILAKEHPEVRYLVLGKTHPNIVVKEGEEYRKELIEKIKSLEIDDKVIFVNRFLTPQETVSYLRATDIYLTPYLNPQQITSGTLAHALSIGRACISTPYLYAREILAVDRGILVPFRNAQVMAKKIKELVLDSRRRREMEKNNFAYSRSMIWQNVAGEYANLFASIYAKSFYEIKVQTAAEFKSF